VQFFVDFAGDMLMMLNGIGTVLAAVWPT